MDLFGDGSAFAIGLVLTVIVLRVAARWCYLRCVRSRHINWSVHTARSTGKNVSKELIVVAGGSALGLIIFTTLVLNWDVVSLLDAKVNSAFGPVRIHWLIVLFLQVTSLGTVLCMGVINVITSALITAFGRKALLVPLWVSFVGAEATTWILKYVVNRPRPIFLDGINEYNPSFPSGHATASTVVFGFLGFIVTSELTSPSRKIESMFWFSSAIATICFSRLFLGLHYFSDVLSGFLVGLIWLMVGIAIAQRSPSTSFLPAP